MHRTEPSFDELRYLDAWVFLAEHYNKYTALKWLIIWQVLNKWDVEIYPRVLVYVFGNVVETVVPDLIENPVVFTDDRFKYIEGENFSTRLKDYCERIQKAYKWWSLYDQ